MSHQLFLDECRQAFAPWYEAFGFDRAESEVIGREAYARFHHGGRTVSVAWEPGSPPIVELLFPAGPGDTPTPWARRGDTPYVRRIPILRVVTPADGLGNATDWRYPSAETFREYLVGSFAALAERERAFLIGGEHHG